MRLVIRNHFTCRVLYPGHDREFMRAMNVGHVVIPQGGDLYSVKGQSMVIPDMKHLISSGFIEDLDAVKGTTREETVAAHAAQVELGVPPAPAAYAGPPPRARRQRPAPEVQPEVQPDIQPDVTPPPAADAPSPSL